MKAVKRTVPVIAYMCDKCGKEFARKDGCRRHEADCKYVPPEPLYKVGEWVVFLTYRVGCIAKVSYMASTRTNHYEVQQLYFEEGKVVKLEACTGVGETMIDGVLDKDQIASAITVLEDAAPPQGKGVSVEKRRVLGCTGETPTVVIGLECYIPLTVKERKRPLGSGDSE